MATTTDLVAQKEAEAKALADFKRMFACVNETIMDLLPQTNLTPTVLSEEDPNFSGGFQHCGLDPDLIIKEDDQEKWNPAIRMGLAAGRSVKFSFNEAMWKSWCKSVKDNHARSQNCDRFKLHLKGHVFNGVLLKVVYCVGLSKIISVCAIGLEKLKAFFKALSAEDREKFNEKRDNPQLFWADVYKHEQLQDFLVKMTVSSNASICTFPHDMFFERSVYFGPYLGPKDVFPATPRASRLSLSAAVGSAAPQDFDSDDYLTKAMRSMFRPERTETVDPLMFLPGIIKPSGNKLHGFVVKDPKDRGLRRPFVELLKIIRDSCRGNGEDVQVLKHLIQLRLDMPPAEAQAADLTQEEADFRLNLFAKGVAQKCTGTCVQDNQCITRLTVEFKCSPHVLRIIHSDSFRRLLNGFSRLSYKEDVSPSDGVNVVEFIKLIKSALEKDVRDMKKDEDDDLIAERREFIAGQAVHRYSSIYPLLGVQDDAIVEFNEFLFIRYFRFYLRLCSSPAVKSFALSTPVFSLICDLLVFKSDNTETKFKYPIDDLLSYSEDEIKQKHKEITQLWYGLIASYLADPVLDESGLWLVPFPLKHRVRDYLAKPQSAPKKRKGKRVAPSNEESSNDSDA